MKKIASQQIQQISRRHFLTLVAKTSLVGVATLFLSKLPSRASSLGQGSSKDSQGIPGTWKIELIEGYPYPPSMVRYAKKARFLSPEHAKEKFYDNQWPVRLVNTAK